MIASAKTRYMRVAPAKVRQVIDLVRGKDVKTASVLLQQVQKGSRDRILKLLHSAVSNAKQQGLSEDQLMISKIFADLGPSWKRYRAASFGRATPLIKRTTHVTIELDLKKK